MGRTEEAERLYLRSLSLRAELKGATHPDLAPVLTSLCRVESELRKFSIGEEHCRHAIAIISSSGPEVRPLLVPAYMNMGLLEAERNQSEEAVRWSLQAVEAAGRTQDIRPRILIKTLISAGKICFTAGRRDQASAMLDRAESLTTQYLAPDHVLRAEVLLTRASFLRRSSRKSEAQRVHNEGLAILNSHRRANSLDHSVDISEFQQRRK